MPKERGRAMRRAPHLKHRLLVLLYQRELNSMFEPGREWFNRAQWNVVEALANEQLVTVRGVVRLTEAGRALAARLNSRHKHKR